MPHFERNIRLISFVVLPILGFILGWSLSQKSAHPPSLPTEEKPPAEVGLEPQVPQGTQPEKPRKKTRKEDVDLDIFWETWNALEANFLQPEKMQTQSQVYGATAGMVDSLEDPYTVFMSPEDTAEFEESINGEFEGIGAEIGIKNEKLTIIAPLKNSPAELAGVRAGDVVAEIDGEPSFGISIQEAVTQIRGPKGEKVVLTIVRENENKPLEITIVRDTIIVEALEWEMRNGIGVIEISQFGPDLDVDFAEMVPEMRLESVRGIVLDLRNNGGGLLDICLKIAGEFFDEKIITKTKGRKFGNTGDLQSGSGGAFLEVPLVVLINRGSASASEIFAGAVQAHDRGLVLGETSFGKGSVQNVVPLSDGSSLKVTIAEWLTPSGDSIHETGVSPDIEIERTDEDFENELDPVLDRAIEILENGELPEILAELRAEEAAEETENEEITPETDE